MDICCYNAAEIVKLAKEPLLRAQLITLQRLCLTGYTCGDLFLQETLLERTGRAEHGLPQDRRLAAVIISQITAARAREKPYIVWLLS